MVAPVTRRMLLAIQDPIARDWLQINTLFKNALILVGALIICRQDRPVGLMFRDSKLAN